MMIQRWELSAENGAAMADGGKFVLYEDVMPVVDTLLAQKQELHNRIAALEEKLDDIAEILELEP